MQETLKQNDLYTLALEKISGQWWLEVIERASGKAKIIRFGQKAKALAFFDRMDFPDILRICDKLNVKWEAMYKAGVK